MRIQEPLTDSLFNGPCPFCGYNGPGYWQPGTHADGCPCHEIYRGESQEDGLRAYIATLRAENARPAACGTPSKATALDAALAKANEVLGDG